MKKLALVAALTVTAAAAGNVQPAAANEPHCLAAILAEQPSICFGGSSCSGEPNTAFEPYYAIRDKYLGEPICPQ